VRTDILSRVKSPGMTLIRGVMIGAVSVGVAMAATGGTASASVASPSHRAASPDGCAPETGYYYSDVTNVNQADSADTESGAEGITLTVTITSGTTITGTVTGTAGFDLDLIVTGAQASVSSAVAHSKTNTVTKSYSWKVAGGSEGSLYVGAQDKSMDWEYGSYNGSCVFEKSQSGTAKLPYLDPYSWYAIV
jgi:hypothetical protein